MVAYFFWPTLHTYTDVTYSTPLSCMPVFLTFRGWKSERISMIRSFHLDTIHACDGRTDRRNSIAVTYTRYSILSYSIQEWLRTNCDRRRGNRQAYRRGWFYMYNLPMLCCSSGTDNYDSRLSRSRIMRVRQLIEITNRALVKRTGT